MCFMYVSMKIGVFYAIYRPNKYEVVEIDVGPMWRHGKTRSKTSACDEQSHC